MNKINGDRIEFIYLQEKNLRVNLGGKYKFDIEDNCLSISDNPEYVEEFYGKNVESIKLLLGKNGSGKSKLMTDLISTFTQIGKVEFYVVIFGDSEESETTFKVYTDIFMEDQILNKSSISDKNIRKVNESGINYQGEFIYWNNLFTENHALGFPKQSEYKTHFINPRSELFRQNSVEGSMVLTPTLSSVENSNRIRQVSGLIQLSSGSSIVEKSKELGVDAHREVKFKFENYNTIIKNCETFIKNNYKKNKSSAPEWYPEDGDKDLLELLDRIVRFLNEKIDNPNESYCADVIGMIIAENIIVRHIFHYKVDSLDKVYYSKQDKLSLDLSSINALQVINEVINERTANIDDIFNLLKEKVIREEASWLDYDKIFDLYQYLNSDNCNVIGESTLYLDDKRILKLIEMYVHTNLSLEYINVEFNNWSSGGQLFLQTFGGLYETLTLRKGKVKNFTILLDEPDIGLHPEWKRNYINYLIKFINRVIKLYNFNIQVIISTNEPYMVSDVLSSDVIYLKHFNNGKYSYDKSIMNNTFGQNIHTLLKKSFFMENGTIGAFAVDKINNLIMYLNEIKKSKESGHEKVNKSYKLDEEKSFKLISVIAEPIIKNKLLMMHSEIFIDKNKSDLKRNFFESEEGKKAFQNYLNSQNGDIND